MASFDHFSFIAPIYERAIPLRNAERIIRIAGLPVDGLLLDAGGGTGRVAQALKTHTRHTVVADSSLGMLMQAQEKDGLLLACTNSETLPFPDRSFERVVMIDALHHVFQQEQTTRELWRVLKPGGRIVIEEPDLRTFPVKLIAVAERLLLMRSRFLAPDQIANLFVHFRAQVQILTETYTAWIVVDKVD